MHWSLALQLLFVPLIYTLFIIKASNNYEYKQYTFYYQTHQYPINPMLRKNKNKTQSQNNSTNSNSIYIDIMIDNIIINVLKSSDYPYIINIIHNKHINNTQQNHPIDQLMHNNNTYIDISIDEITNNTDKNNINIEPDHTIESITSNTIQQNENENIEFDEISLEYEQYEQWNEIQIWHTPHRHRRRLRQCHKRAWYPFHYYNKHYWCKPIAPPRWDPYWIRRTKRIGRFIAVYPGIQAKARFNFKKCAAFCRQNYGGLAAIHSKHEKEQAKAACWYMLSQPKAKNQRDYSGNWRGHSCFIGLRRPFKKWEDKTKVNYKYWQPGEPNNGGHRRVCSKRSWWGGCRKYEWRKNADEDCTELYAFHYGRWNDISCKAKLSCLCQKPRGHIHGPYIGVSATRTHKEAHLYCKRKYGTTLATISTDGENKHVLNACKAITQSKSLGHCWIGLQRPFDEWDDGTDADEKFTNWFPGEPNNKNEKCVELYSEHRGLWNDLSCNYKRYFVCNAQSKIQRMDFHTREEMIQRRMGRHQKTWYRYQAKAKRAKIRKMYFEKMRKLRAQQRAQRRREMQKRREYMRQMAFKKFSGMMANNIGSFSANSKFGDVYDKRRRMRIGIERESYGYQRRVNEELATEKYKYKKKEMFKKDKEFYRDMEDKMWGDEMDEMDGIGYDNDDMDMDIMSERVNVSPKRCVLVIVDGVLYEISVNDDFVFVKKYVERVRRISGGDVDGGGGPIKSEIKTHSDDEVYNVSVGDDGYGMGVGGFEVYKYEKAMMDDWGDGGVMDIVRNNLRYVRVDEFMYDFESNHKKQCFDGDNKMGYRVCLEFMSEEKDVVLYVGIDGWFGYDEDMYLFSEDNEWNEVEYVRIDDGDSGGSGVNDKVVKCLMFYESKLCVIEQFKYVEDRSDEYRVVVLTEMNEDDDGYNHHENYDEYE